MDTVEKETSESSRKDKRRKAEKPCLIKVAHSFSSLDFLMIFLANVLSKASICVVYINEFIMLKENSLQLTTLSRNEIRMKFYFPVFSHFYF